ncbi:hypothetical protein B0H34DRAFT_398159 [Crassisporium funariophilum]|nr:hypothetical protein B0H34DRAFT_398159 [Crassisporium funariophilum]
MNYDSEVQNRAGGGQEEREWSVYLTSNLLSSKLYLRMNREHPRDTLRRGEALLHVVENPCPSCSTHTVCRCWGQRLRQPTPPRSMVASGKRKKSTRTLAPNGIVRYDGIFFKDVSKKTSALYMQCVVPADKLPQNHRLPTQSFLNLNTAGVRSPTKLLTEKVH